MQVLAPKMQKILAQLSLNGFSLSNFNKFIIWRLILLADIITAERLVKSMLNKYIFLPYISER
ncbi:hypothetical protein, partial [Campylobacter troglodytis]|uniref:hypothetical protein n=1 Tax=Campylobacter troglodytis TaxID=654363 RepID=UPI001C8DB10C